MLVKVPPVKSLVAQRRMLYDMLALLLLEVGEALVLDLIFESEKLQLRSDEIVIGLIGP